MREINNNRNSVNFQGIQKAPAETPVQAEAAAQVPANEPKEIKDLGKMPAASLGKTLIASDSIESDMKFLEKNPALAAELNKAIDKYAESHSEEETLQMIEKMHQEFVAKK
ncbi:MAG: hypothetical protein NC191_04220 [Muribaculaceae bacterium]|nr:hypothetical protein [Muribaculaceae bacterium]